MTSVIQRGRIADRRDQISLFRGIARGFSYLTPDEMRWTIALFASMFVSALLGLVGMASVIPFFDLMVKPDPFARDTTLGQALQFLGVTSSLTAIVLFGGIFVALMGLKGLHAILHVRLIGRFCARAETRMATDTLRRIVDAPFEWYVRQNSSVLRDIVMAHIIEWSREIIRPTLNLANNGLMLLAAIAMLLVWTPAAALAVGAFTLLVGYSLIWVSQPKMELSGRRKRRHNLLAGVVAAEAISGGRDVRMSSAGRVLVNEFRRDYSIYAYSDADARQWQIVPRQGIEAIGVLAIVGGAIGAMYSGVDRTEAASVLALYAVVAVRLMPVVGDFANAISNIQVALPHVANLDALFSELGDFHTPLLNAERFNGWKEIKLTAVGYTYQESQTPALHDINFTFKRGLSYGLVGSSGAGKSTLADIVAGLLPPKQGILSINGTAVDDSLRASWRAKVAYVSQTPIIFDATLADNIALGEVVGEVEIGGLCRQSRRPGLTRWLPILVKGLIP